MSTPMRGRRMSSATTADERDERRPRDRRRDTHLDGISLSFGGVKALTGISLSRGARDTIIGPNGWQEPLFNVINGVYHPRHHHLPRQVRRD